MKKNNLTLEEALKLIDEDKTIAVMHFFEGHRRTSLLYKGKAKYFYDEDFSNHYVEYEVKKIDFSVRPPYLEIVI